MLLGLVGCLDVALGGGALTGHLAGGLGRRGFGCGGHAWRGFLDLGWRARVVFIGRSGLQGSSFFFFVWKGRKSYLAARDVVDMLGVSRPEGSHLKSLVYLQIYASTCFRMFFSCFKFRSLTGPFTEIV